MPSSKKLAAKPPSPFFEPRINLWADDGINKNVELGLTKPGTRVCTHVYTHVEALSNTRSEAELSNLTASHDQLQTKLSGLDVSAHAHACACVRSYVRAFMRAFMRACVRACGRGCTSM